MANLIDRERRGHALLREAVASSGLSQAAFARAGDLALAALDVHHWRAMRESFLAADVGWTWRMLLQGRDHLALLVAERHQVLLDAWEAVPGTVGSAGWDALLAAVSAHELESADL